MAEEVESQGRGVWIGEVAGIPTVFHNDERLFGFTHAAQFGPEYVTVVSRIPGEGDPLVQILGVEDLLFVIHHAADIIETLREENEGE